MTRFPDSDAGFAPPALGVVLSPGTRFGKYRILRLLARGGMGEVYLATSESASVRKLVAIKRLHVHLEGQPEFLAMFLDEARLGEKLRHRNLVRTFDSGFACGSHYIAMEFAHGKSVHAILRASSHLRKRIPIEHAIEIAAGLCAGLHDAHELTGAAGEALHVVHRDVSPQNVLVTWSGVVKLFDFGVARSTDQHAETRTGTLKGKLSYMSPEQCSGEMLDRRSDVFAVGILLYELTLGKKLYRGKSDFEVMRAIVEEEVVPPRTLDASYDAGLEAVVMRALARDPALRFQTARDMAEALAGVARRLSLTPSEAGLRHFLEDEFRDEVLAWQRAEASGLTLGEHLARALPEVLPSAAEGDRDGETAWDAGARTPEGKSTRFRAQGKPPRTLPLHGAVARAARADRSRSATLPLWPAVEKEESRVPLPVAEPTFSAPTGVASPDYEGRASDASHASPAAPGSALPARDRRTPRAVPAAAPWPTAAPLASRPATGWFADPLHRRATVLIFVLGLLAVVGAAVVGLGSSTGRTSAGTAERVH